MLDETKEHTLIALLVAELHELGIDLAPKALRSVVESLRNGQCVGIALPSGDLIRGLNHSESPIWFTRDGEYQVELTEEVRAILARGLFPRPSRVTIVSA